MDSIKLELEKEYFRYNNDISISLLKGSDNLHYIGYMLYAEEVQDNSLFFTEYWLIDYIDKNDIEDIPGTRVRNLFRNNPKLLTIDATVMGHKYNYENISKEEIDELIIDFLVIYDGYVDKSEYY